MFWSAYRCWWLKLSAFVGLQIYWKEFYRHLRLGCFTETHLDISVRFISVFSLCLCHQYDYVLYLFPPHTLVISHAACKVAHMVCDVLSHIPSLCVVPLTSLKQLCYTSFQTSNPVTHLLPSPTPCWVSSHCTCRPPWVPPLHLLQNPMGNSLTLYPLLKCKSSLLHIILHPEPEAYSTWLTNLCWINEECIINLFPREGPEVNAYLRVTQEV